ncbi:hypothetical protein [Cesiribacter andamanensis]|uniref:hypothetical protein n=1 Tax=Cesiribacter andamanensis TaxID=649507 RepID=UPI00034CBD38|nr:hypothetical protein [Cesiribacter andamanensis]
MTKAPEDGKRYVVLGECTGKGMKGIVNNEFEAAHKQVEACACKHGGNAIILTNSYVQGGRDQYGNYLQYNGAVKALVIYIQE